MIALYLLAAHMLGDFVMQNRWQAARKLTEWRYRAQHVTVYTLCFAPVAFYTATYWKALAFLWLLASLHYLTDSRRFTSTIGDWIEWKTLTPDERQREWAGTTPVDRLGVASMNELPPGPWTPIALMVDQSLHVCQLAILGGLFLS